MEIIIKKLTDIKPYEKNPRRNDEAVKYVANSIKEFGFKVPIVIDKDGVIVCGHTRYKAAKKLKLKEVPCILADDLNDEQIKAYRLADNKVSEKADWDFELLTDEINDLLNFDMVEFGFEDVYTSEQEEQTESTEEAYEDNFEIEEPVEAITKPGDIWQLGRHRLLCGDSTDLSCINLLMDGKKADMVFTDPPYGMKKENDGVANDNLNYDDLLAFNKLWIPLTFTALKDNGSWYCWGIDEPLMDIYSNILKPMMKQEKITFRNLITWDKGHGQGQNSEEFRMYPIADEKCLFVVCGVHGFNTNANNYFEQYEPIRKYLEEQRLLCGWNIPQMKTIAGHSDKSRDHWTSKSQWNLLTEDVYKKFQEWAINNGVPAFQRAYADIKQEYEDIKVAYCDAKPYFNNTHDNMNNVWHFDRTTGEERASAGGHATPKPIALCARAIKSSSREDEIVLDVFGGSGSTLIACEQLNRNARLIELEPKWCDVIIKRWEAYTGQKAVLLN